MTAPTVPTAASIKLRFKEFADVDDPVIEFAIEEARTEVDDGWTAQADIALVYLVAHYVASANQNASSGGDGDGGTIASESIGRLSITYARTAQSTSADATDKESTSYGRRYLEILAANFSGARII
jgi:hypothetical protein